MALFVNGYLHTLLAMLPDGSTAFLAAAILLALMQRVLAALFRTRALRTFKTASTLSESSTPKDPRAKVATWVDDDSDLQVRKEFIQELVALAYDVLDPKEAHAYITTRLLPRDDEDSENKSTPDGGWSLFAESQMATISANNANSSTSILYDPVPALVDEVDAETSKHRSVPHPLVRRGAFIGASHIDKFFKTSWWLQYDLDEAMERRGRLENSFKTVRIKRRSLSVIPYQPGTSSPAPNPGRPWDECFRIAFQKRFTKFDILEPGDTDPSTSWPGLPSGWQAGNKARG
ncbi:hypothetical protein C8Q76DRAFT_76519 [Earliella scabrosa]|nr:hypothetical protein C8Q76DRAFT_76519 [Earliella scabrosa]